MFVNGIGEVEFVWKKVPEGGILLREENGVVLLEEHLDAEWKNVDVIHQFDEDYSLYNRADFGECLVEARKYVPDMNIPIYIQSPSVRYKEEEDSEKQRKEELMRIVDKTGRQPWRRFAS